MAERTFTKKKTVKRLLAILLTVALFIPAFTVNAADAVTGDGSARNPYLLYTQDDLLQIPTLGSDKNYKMMNDITLSGYWQPLPTFSGVLDGNNFAITNLEFGYFYGEELGLFSATDGAHIKNLTVEGGHYKTVTFFGAITGFSTQSIFENCIVNLGIDGGTYCGGIAGYASRSTFKRCVNIGSITGVNSGGICGWMEDSLISECMNSANIDGGFYTAGGIVGRAGGVSSISNSYNTGKIGASGHADLIIGAGGIIGLVDNGTITVSKCYSTGTVRASYGNASGILGKIVSGTATVERCAAINSEISYVETGTINRISDSGGTFNNNLSLNTMKTYLTRRVNYQYITQNINITGGTATNSHGQNTTMAQFKTQATYEALGWDFENIWVMGDEFPVLQLRAEDNEPEIITEKINDNHPEVQYTGAWSYYRGNEFYNGDEHFSNQAGAYAEFTFDGTSINYIAATSNNLGKCDIYIDGVLEQSGVDAYSPTLEPQKSLFYKDGLTDGQHIIKIVVTGERNADAADCFVTVDAFEVDGDGSGTAEIMNVTYNDNAPEIRYNGSWAYYSGSAFYGGDEHFSNQAGAYAELDFYGTSISYIAATSNNLGMCDIYIDGVLEQSDVDAYSPALEPQQVLFYKDGLTAGWHTIKIVVTGNRNQSATDGFITVDAFGVN